VSKKVLKSAGLLALIMVIAVGMTACDMGSDDTDVTEEHDGTGELAINISDSGLEALQAESTNVEIQSSIEEEFTEYRTEVRIDYVDTDRFHDETFEDTDLDEVLIDSVEFTNIVAGEWDITVTLEAKYAEDDEWYKVASEEEVITATVEEGETTPASITVVQEEGEINLVEPGAGIDDLGDLERLELHKEFVEDYDYDPDDAIRNYDDDGDTWEGLEAVQHYLYLEYIDEEHDEEMHESIMVLPGVPINVEVRLYEGNLDINIEYELPPSVPTDVEAEIVEEDDEYGIEIDWNHPDHDEMESYNVVRREREGREYWNPIAEGLDGTAYTDDDLQPGVLYEYAVVAVDEDGLTSDYSEPSQPEGLEVDYVTEFDDLSNSLETETVRLIVLGDDISLEGDAPIEYAEVIDLNGYEIFVEEDEKLDIGFSTEAKIKNGCIDVYGLSVDVNGRLENVEAYIDNIEFEEGKKLKMTWHSFLEFAGEQDAVFATGNKKSNMPDLNEGGTVELSWEEIKLIDGGNESAAFGVELPEPEDKEEFEPGNIDIEFAEEDGWEAVFFENNGTIRYIIASYGEPGDSNDDGPWSGRLFELGADEEAHDYEGTHLTWDEVIYGVNGDEEVIDALEDFEVVGIGATVGTEGDDSMESTIEEINYNGD